MAPTRRPANLEVDTSGTPAEQPRRSARLATPHSARASEAPVSPSSRKRTRIDEHLGDADEAMMDGAPEVEEDNGGGRPRKGKAKAAEAEEPDSDFESESDDDDVAPRDIRKKAATKPIKPQSKATPRRSSRSTKTATNKGKGTAEETPWWEEIPPTPDSDEDSGDGEDAIVGKPMKRFTTSSGPGGVLTSVIYVVDEGMKPQCRLRSQNDLPTHVAENWDGENLRSLEDDIRKFDMLIDKKVKGSHRSFQLKYIATYPSHPQGKAIICGATTVNGQKQLLTGWKKHWCALYGRTNAQNAINRQCRKEGVRLPFKVSSISKGRQTRDSTEPSRDSSSIPSDLSERLEEIERNLREMTAQISERSASPESPTPERTVHKPGKSKAAKEAADNKAAERRRLLAQLAELDEPSRNKSIPRIVIS